MAQLNELVSEALENNPPPTIVLFCNMPDAFSAPYQRYLVNYLRDGFLATLQIECGLVSQLDGSMVKCCYHE